MKGRLTVGDQPRERKKSKPSGRANFHSALAWARTLPQACMLPLEDLGRDAFEDPPAHGRSRTEPVSQGRDPRLVEVHEETFCHDHDPRVGTGDAVEKALSGLVVRKIHRNALDDAGGFFAREHFRLFVENRRSIGFDPHQRGWRRQAVGAGIETGGEVQHGIGVNGPNGVDDQLVEDPRTHSQRPGEPARSRMCPRNRRHPFGDPFAAFPSQSSRERIDEQSVGTLGFQAVSETSLSGAAALN